MTASSLPSGLTDRPLIRRYGDVRRRSQALCKTLSAEDQVVQSMQDVSPTKWHLAHTSWFFEHFVLAEYVPGYPVFDPQYQHLFNSYYYSVGEMFSRPSRGLLSRPTVAQIYDYRAHVDEAMTELLSGSGDPALQFLVELGLNHEQQHQELILTDIKHVFSINPLGPALVEQAPGIRSSAVPSLGWRNYTGGIREIGADGTGFCFDNETPRHRVLLNDFQLADRLITNREYREFIDDGGYQKSTLWLSDGWAWLQQNGISRPIYWSEDLQQEFTLAGWQAQDPETPVSHVNFYEADAFARWAGARLATEMEWETAAVDGQLGRFAEANIFHPAPLADDDPPGLGQYFGDLWEWTSSPYSAYPGFQPLAGSLGEYNGKFMSSQMVCRGGSCATPSDHIRPSYRNFFYPDARWQFIGIRLARNAD